MKSLSPFEILRKRFENLRRISAIVQIDRVLREVDQAEHDFNQQDKEVKK